MNPEINPTELETLMDQAFLEGPSSTAMEKLRVLLAQHPEHRALWEEYRQIRKGLHWLEAEHQPRESILATLRQAARKPQFSVDSPQTDQVTSPLTASPPTSPEGHAALAEIQPNTITETSPVLEPAAQPIEVIEQEQPEAILAPTPQLFPPEPLNAPTTKARNREQKLPWSFSDALPLLNKLGRYLLRTPSVAAATLTFFLVVGLSSRYLLKEHPSPLNDSTTLPNPATEPSPEQVPQKDPERQKTKSILPAPRPDIRSERNESEAKPDLISRSAQFSEAGGPAPTSPKQEVVPALAGQVADSAPPPSPGAPSVVQSSEKSSALQSSEVSTTKSAKSAPTQVDYVASAKKKMRAGNYRSALGDLRKAQNQKNTKEIRRLIAECQKKIKSEKKKK